MRLTDVKGKVAQDIIAEVRRVQAVR
jgi:hypothetical protein